VTLDEIRQKLAAHQAELKEMGVTSLALFGSAVRGEATASSDVDLLVEFDRPVDLFHFFTLQHRLEEILGVEKVDLVQPGAIREILKELILAEAINVAP
jgi:predicted nucleotidyltransferase